MDPNRLWFHINVMDLWGPTTGVQDFYPGADALNLSVTRVSDDFEFRWRATNICLYIMQVINPDGSIVDIPDPTYPEWFSPGDHVVTRPASDFQLGELTFKVKLKPYYNAYYGAYEQPWLEKQITFENLDKPPLTSNSPTATATNNQRKIAQSEQGVFCLVYESDGRIWFTRSNDAVNWSPEVCISNGVAGTDNHKYPSIVVKSEVANIVWQHEIGSGAFGVGKIFLRRYAIALDSWGTTQQIGQYNFPENVVSTPVIAANNLSIDGTQDNKRVAWNDPYGIKIRNNNNGTWGGVGTVPGTHSNCYYPSIINYNGGHYGLC